jgi:hypothetical protein
MSNARLLQSARPGSIRGCSPAVAGLLALGFMAGCACADPAGGGAEDAAAGAPAAPGNASSSPGLEEIRPTAPPAGKPAGNVMTGDVPADLIGAAISDAVRRSGAARADVKVVTAEPVTWSDGSMGCPQPGMMYTQALSPGYRIVLEAGGQMLNYHSSADGGPTFCPAERVEPPAAAGALERI